MRHIGPPDLSVYGMQEIAGGEDAIMANEGAHLKREREKCEDIHESEQP